MPSIFEHPSGIARYFTDDDGEMIYEHGTGRAVYCIHEYTVCTMDGTPVFWLGEGEEDNYLHPFDDTPPRFYFSIHDKKPGLGLDDEVTNAEFAVLIAKYGRREATKKVRNQAKKK